MCHSAFFLWGLLWGRNGHLCVVMDKKIVKIPLTDESIASRRVRVEGALRLIIRDPDWVLSKTVPVSFKGLRPQDKISVKVSAHLWDHAKKALERTAPLETPRVGCRVAGILRRIKLDEREWNEPYTPSSLPLLREMHRTRAVKD